MFILFIQTTMGPYRATYTRREDLMKNADLVATATTKGNTLVFRNNKQEIVSILNGKFIVCGFPFTSITAYECHLSAIYSEKVVKREIRAMRKLAGQATEQEDEKEDKPEPGDWINDPDFWKKMGDDDE